uniref:Uncharacterized protein n=1 Tax=viral metagenome TaxID=1070528 RepID=A0A6C0CCM5_9ZZZZ
MLTLCNDVIIKISENLKDKEKINLISTTKLLNELKRKMRYVDLVFVERIESLEYFDNFENIKIENAELAYPKGVKFVHF